MSAALTANPGPPATEDLDVTAVVEVQPTGEFWQGGYNGRVLVRATERRGAINAAAALLRRQLKDPAAVAAMTFAGVELHELLAAPALDPNWKRKGPPVAVERFAQAGAFVQT